MRENKTIEYQRNVLATNIQTLLDRKGKTQTDMARDLNIPETTVSSWIGRKKYPRLDKIQMMADYFNVKRSDITDEKAKEVFNLSSSLYDYLPTTISAGLPINVEGVTNADKIQIPDSIMGKWAGQNDIFVSKINGDSMDKVMANGSLIAIKPITQEGLKNGDMVVFSDNYEYSVKYYHRHGDKIIFKPASNNPVHYDQDFNINDNITIHGKVVVYIVELD